MHTNVLKQSRVVIIFNLNLMIEILITRKFCSENISRIGECVNNYRKQKLIMAPGSEPDAVKELTRIIEPYVYGNLI